MNHFSVNGKEIRYNTTPEQRIEELMLQIRREFNSDSALISSIRINGSELNGEEELALASLTVGQIESVEVFTSHPRELAEETLQSLSEFTLHLESFSRQAADHLEAGQFPHEFVKLVEGIQTFTEALEGSKSILRITKLDPVNILEADLTSILKDLLSFAEGGEKEFVVDLMRNHLPLNLEDWRREGIPALIRSRDS
jgi:hypothetical protein